VFPLTVDSDVVYTMMDTLMARFRFFGGRRKDFGDGCRGQVTACLRPHTFLSTYDGFDGTGLFLAMGVLGHNKGLAPTELALCRMCASNLNI
jgi:hypothetical protein